MRADHLRLEGLTPTEAKRAIEAALGRVITAAAVTRLSKSPYARNWLDLHAITDACLADALAQGERSISIETVGRVVGADDAEPDTPPNDDAVAAFLDRGLKRAS